MKSTNRICLLALGLAMLFSLPLPMGASAQSTNSQTSFSLLINTDETALVSADGKQIGTARAFLPMKSPFTPGYILAGISNIKAGAGDMAGESRWDIAENWLDSNSWHLADLLASEYLRIDEPYQNANETLDLSGISFPL
jgi:hypothetical protein